MSLQLAAQHLASRGRGPDTQLIHMAPQEVAGLHALAKAHGGELTTNPDTGLPEAGFLSSILPMLLGAGLSFIPGVGPLMAAGIVGGGTTLATGSLGKGLMAGLGAFGGAGLAGGLAGAGTGALSSAAGSTAANAVTPALATEGLAGAATEGLAGAGLTPELAAQGYGSLAPTSTSFGAFGEPMLAAAPAPAAAGITQIPTTLTQAPALSQSAADIGNTYAQEQAAQNAVAKQLATATPMDTLKAGFGEVVKDPSRFMTSQNLKYAGMAAAPGIMDMLTPKQQAEEEKEKLKAFEYSYSPNYNPTPDVGYTGAQTGERMHFDHRLTRTAAGGGLMDIQPIGAMSQQNQSQMRPAYAQGGVSDMAVNPYTGAENFAEGGDTASPPPKAVRPVEQDPYYTMSGQSADMYKYLMGQMPARAPAPAPVAAPVLFQAAATPAPAASKGVASAFLKRMLGQSQGDSTIRPYTRDPITGQLVAMPIADNTNFDAGPAQAYSNPNITPWDMGGTGGNANGGLLALAQGGPSHLGDYSDGGRLLRGPGNGTSDNIPASIGDKRPARLADGEFVIPSRIVSELGNGSTEAGARQLYAMMDRVQKARAKTTGKNKVAFDAKARNQLPA